jgi:hypothetical protein
MVQQRGKFRREGGRPRQRRLPPTVRPHEAGLIQEAMAQEESRLQPALSGADRDWVGSYLLGKPYKLAT